MKIVITDRDTVTNGDVDLSVFEKFGEVEYYGSTSAAELPDRIRDAEAVLCNKTQITSAVMEQCSRLRYIGLFATGYNNIDLPAARQHGITVCNAGSYSTEAVAQLVFALMLELSCNTSRYSRYTEAGGWIKSPTFSAFVYPQRELCGKTLGIIGYGSIGRRVAAIGSAFGMKVLVHTRTAREDGTVRFVPFDELLAQSDVISVHCPLTEATENLFSDASFAKMKRGAVFINTSRGGVVDETALRKALDDRRLSGAGLDVLRVEPMSAGCPLLGAPNLIITPHVAWAPLETRQRLLDIVAENLSGFLSGEPRNVVS